MNNGNCSINHCKGNNCALYIFGFSTWSKNIVSMWYFSYKYFFSFILSKWFYSLFHFSRGVIFNICFLVLENSISPIVSCPVLFPQRFLSLLLPRPASSVWLHNHTHNFSMECGVVWVVPLWSSSSWLRKLSWAKGQVSDGKLCDEEMMLIVYFCFIINSNCPVSRWTSDFMLVYHVIILPGNNSLTHRKFLFMCTGGFSTFCFWHAYIQHAACRLHAGKLDTNSTAISPLCCA